MLHLLKITNYTIRPDWHACWKLDRSSLGNRLRGEESRRGKHHLIIIASSISTWKLVAHNICHLFTGSVPINSGPKTCLRLHRMELGDGKRKPSSNHDNTIIQATPFKMRARNSNPPLLAKLHVWAASAGPSLHGHLWSLLHCCHRHSGRRQPLRRSQRSCECYSKGGSSWAQIGCLNHFHGHIVLSIIIGELSKQPFPRGK